MQIFKLLKMHWWKFLITAVLMTGIQLGLLCFGLLNPEESALGVLDKLLLGIYLFVMFGKWITGFLVLLGVISKLPKWRNRK